MRSVRSLRGLAIAVAMSALVALPGPAGASPLAFFTETTPPTANYTPTSVVPLVGDFTGDGRADVFFYRPGTANESLFIGNANRTFTHVAASSISVTPTYQPLVGDFDG